MALGTMNKVSNSSPVVPLQASAVDLPSSAASCDALKHASEHIKESLNKTAHIFPSCASLRSFKTITTRTGDDLNEYAQLVVRELHCGELSLQRFVVATADVFSVPKSDPNKQRKIWNGKAISQLAARPPRPE